jgi:molecular chaperone DnaK
VAVGAAVQAGVLGGEVTDILLLDVTPLTLSIETLGGVATALIERNTTIPTRRSQIFSTAADSQTQVEINVVQGERPLAMDNKSLGRFVLDGIPPAMRGVPQIEVTFDIDANGILQVTAKDKATARSQHITITASSGLAKDEVERMRREAESHAEEDRQRREKVEVRNQADNTIYGAERSLRDFGDKIAAGLKSEIEAAVAECRQALDSDDVDQMRRTTEALGRAVQKIGGAMYEQPGPAAGTQPEGSTPAGDNPA